MNLNNTPSGGPLTVADLDAYRRGHMRRPYIPAGCNQQGRIEAAHAASEIDDDEPARGRFDASCVIVWVAGTLGLWAAVSAFLLALRS